MIAVAAQLEDYSEAIDTIAKVIWGEARGVNSKAEQAGVAWCILNRADCRETQEPSDVIAVATARYQFAYSRSAPVTEELRELAQDVVIRWLLEKQGVSDVGRVLPKEYIYFAGRNGHNWFRDKYRGGKYWGWGLPDPYVDEIVHERN